MTKKGYKQTAEHIRKRFLNGSPNRKGDKAGVKAGRSRALRTYPELPSACQDCGVTGQRLDRHHIDDNTLNNSPENIAFVCRRCHMVRDGRLDILKANAVRNVTHLVDAAASEKRSRSSCKRGHVLTEENVYIHAGRRHCRACQKIHCKVYRETHKEPPK